MAVAKKKTATRKKKAAPKKAAPKTPAKGKQGKRECPKCKKLMGVRKAVCDCGHKFPAPQKRAAKRARATAGAFSKDQLTAEKILVDVSVLKKQLAAIEGMLKAYK